MNPAPKSLQWTVWGCMALTMLAIVVAFILQQHRQERAQAGAVSNAGSGASLPVLFEVTDFALTNQNGQAVTRSDLRGQVWIADIIFTRCAGPCPEMTRRMAELQTAIAARDPVRFVTLTTDPEFDTPAVLKTYARRFEAQPDRWHFLTGSRQQIADLAVRGLKLSALEKEPDKQENENDLFIHSTMFVIVDQQGRARAVVEGADPDVKPRVLQAVNQLLQENSP